MSLTTETACRIALAAVFAAVLVVGLPHRVRADRAGGRVSPRGDPRWFWALMALVGPPVALVCLGFILRPRLVEFAQLGLPPEWRWLGVPVAGAGVWLFAAVFRHLGLNVTSTSIPRANATLVTGGPYRWIRHPMYSAALLLIVAATLLTANAIVLGGGLGMFALLAARSRVEERRLVEKFGDDYRAYQARTGRFVPRLSWK